MEIYTDASQFVWRPAGVTDAEVLEEWPYVFQAMLTRPIDGRMNLKSEQFRSLHPSVTPIVHRILTHLHTHRAAQALQARIRRASVRHERVVAILGATHSRLGERSLLGLVLGPDVREVLFDLL